MKILTLAFLVITGAVVWSEPVIGATMDWCLIHQGKTGTFCDGSTVYPGKYTLKINIKGDTLGCSLRVETKSNNTSLVQMPKSLPVSTKTFHPLGSHCITSGTITVSKPSTPMVRVIMTLTYGPGLTKTSRLRVAQKVSITSVTVSPQRGLYSRGQHVTLKINFSRMKLRGEREPLINYRIVNDGKLCVLHKLSDGTRIMSELHLSSYVNYSRFRSQTLEIPVILCKSGRTIAEFYWSVRLSEPMIASGSKRISLNVSGRLRDKKSSIR